MSLELEEQVILPEQLLERPAVAEEGELLLLWTVLHDAVHIFEQSVRMNSLRSRDFREAEQWLFSNDRSWVTSFENICDALDINARRLRLMLLELRWNHVQAELARAS